MSESVRIREYVESLFSSAPQTEKVIELKEELLINLNEKYDDLVKNGHSQNEAYDNVIKGIGDIGELIEGVRLENPFFKSEETKRQKNIRALTLALAVGLYFLAFTVMFFPSFLTVSYKNSFPASVILIGIATCLVVFINVRYPRYKKTNNTIVEQFKEWRVNDRKKEKIYGNLSALLWCATPAIYLLFSFKFGHWHVSWLIFILATIAQLLLDLAMHSSGGLQNPQSRERIFGDCSGILWVGTVFLYFAMSFTFGNWHISWVIFFIATIAQIVMKFIFDMFD